MSKINRLLLKKILGIFIFLLFAFCLLRVWNYGQARPGIDFYQFWAVGQKVVERDVINIYSEDASRGLGFEFLQNSRREESSRRFRWAAENRKILEVYSTPFFYSLFGICASGEYDRNYTIYQFLSLACTVIAVILLCRLLRFSFITAMLFIVIFTAWFEPFLTDVRVANVNQIQLALLALFLWLQSRHAWRLRDFLGGIVLGLLVMFKPNLVFVLLMLTISWLINRRYKKLAFEYAGVTVSGIGAFVLSSIIFGSMQCWADWFAAILSAPSSIIKVTMGNFGLSMLFMDWFNIDAVKFMTTVLVGVAIAFIWFSRRPALMHDAKDLDRAFFEDALIAGMGCLIYLLSMRLVWLHYYVLTIPSAIFILRPEYALHQPARSKRRLIRRVLGIAAIIAIAVNPLQAVFGIRTPHGVALMISIGTAVLFALAAWELKSIKNTYEAHC